MKSRFRPEPLRIACKIKQAGENDAGTSVMGYEWYAPKVGVVKSLVTIKQKSKEGPKSETRTYQLVSFKP